MVCGADVRLVCLCLCLGARWRCGDVTLGLDKGEKEGEVLPFGVRATTNGDDSCRALRIRMVLCCCFRAVLLL